MEAESNLLERSAARIQATRALYAGLMFSAVFTGLIWLTGWLWLDPGPLTPDRHPFWYQWQLQQPTFLSHASAWGLYALHQATLWGVIWYAQQQRPAYSDRLHAFNLFALLANALFISLHLLQTHLWYDGLAQTVPEWTSQWSVIMVLVAILLMENQRRGLFFGRKLDFVTRSAGPLRKYHGYYFSWAIVYTFWYHPMEFSSGHLLGFAYMFLLLLQSSLFFTRAHVNRYWTVCLEAGVIIHALLVAVMNGDSWPMFVCGFLGIFVITQMHGLGWSRRLRAGLGAAYVATVAAIYSFEGFHLVFQVGLIPLTEYATVILLSLLILAGLRLRRWWLARGVAPVLNG
ncbi:MAG: hypothetical protein JJT85_04805 [Chromatiales bacterium]|nr:hypothetical protein [Chromatiales bacterium]